MILNGNYKNLGDPECSLKKKKKKGNSQTTRRWKNAEMAYWESDQFIVEA